MQVVHIAFTYLSLTLIYFHLECKILLKISESAPTATEKRREYSERKTISLPM